MRIRFWGVRGSIPAPGKDTVVFGGNTTCLEIEDADGNTLIFDAGTGIRMLGFDLLKRKISETHLFITHTHWDHIQGFPFFVPCFIPGNRINIYGPTNYKKSLKGIMDLQMDYEYFPVSTKQLAAEISYRDLKEESIKIGNTIVTTKYSNHPVTGLCYKIESGGKTVVFSGDMEPYYNMLKSDSGEVDEFDDFEDDGDEDMDKIVEERNRFHLEFCRSDLLIHDAQYTQEEYQKFVGWGHSPMEYVVQLAKDAGVGHVVMTHHDPMKTDEALLKIEKSFRDDNNDAGLRINFAKEGLEITI